MERTKICLLIATNFSASLHIANSHSYSLALKSTQMMASMVIKYNEGPRDEDFGLIGYIDISNRIFLELFDRFGNCGEQIQS